MTSIFTGLDTTNFPSMTAINGQVYYTNDFNPVKVLNMNGGNNAGIDGPSGALGAPTATAGNCTNGTHLIRYRYRNSRTQYPSNPSDNLSYTVSGGNGSLLFNVGSDYTASTDPKVTHIDIEMTAVGDATFYRAQTALNTATTITVSISDDNLTQQENVTALYGSVQDGELFANEPPSSCAVVVAHRNRLWLFGHYPFAIGSTAATFTQSSTSIVYADGSSEWVGRYIQADGDTTNYAISAVSSTAITISAVYGGSTGTKAATVYSGNPNVAPYSRLNFPESFGTNLQREFLYGTGDIVRGAFSRRDALYVFGQYSSQRLTFSVNPSATTSNLIPILGNRGTLNQRCLVDADGRLFAWDRLGMYEVSEAPTQISNHIFPTLAELCDYSESAQFHGIYDPVERVIAWFFVASGDTVPKYAAVVDFDTIDSSEGPRWQFYQFRQGITSSTMVASTDGQVRAWVGDENGYTWAFSTTNTFDGVYPTNPAVLTAAAGASTTIIPIDESLNTDVTITGSIAYFPSTGEERVVSTNSTSSVTLATALSGAPADGTEFWIGSFPCEYRTKWWAGQGMQNKKKPSYFYLFLYPGTATGKMQVYFYKDFSTQPYTFADADSSYVGWDGVTFVGGVLTIDLDAGSGDGFVAVNMPADFWRVMQARLVSTKPDGTLRILDMGFRVGKAEEVEVGAE
jgi:hypothetical protein